MNTRDAGGVWSMSRIVKCSRTLHGVQLGHPLLNPADIVSQLFHPGLSKIPARVGGPRSDIINLGITIGGQKLGAGRFLIPGAGQGLTCCLPKFVSDF